MDARTRALALLKTFKGGHYLCGTGVLPQAGRLARELGARALVFANAGG